MSLESEFQLTLTFGNSCYVHLFFLSPAWVGSLEGDDDVSEIHNAPKKIVGD